MRKLVKLVGQPDQDFLVPGTEKLTQHSESSTVIFPTSGANLAALMGHGSPADHLWLGNEASGSTDIGDTGGANLTDSGTPTHQVSHPTFESVTQFSNLSSDAMDAANNTILDVTTGSITIVETCEMIDDENRLFLGKRDTGSPFEGYELQGNTIGHILVLFDDGPNIDNEAIAVAHQGIPTLVIAAFDRNANNVQLFGTLGDSPGGAIAATGSLTNTGTFAIGEGRTTVVGHYFTWAGIFLGAAAEGINGTNHATLEASMGIF